MRHSHATKIEQRHTEGGPLIGFQATCACGWVGEVFHERSKAENEGAHHTEWAPRFPETRG